jgi:FtsH-binding integral membrane protein
MGFIKKVYSILMVQLCITAVGVAISVQMSGFRDFSNNNPAFYFIAAGLYIVSVIMLGCYKSIARRVPLNYTILLILTLSMTYIV